MKAAVLEEIGKPLAVRDLGVVFGNGNVFEDEVRVERGQVLIRVTESGICGAQIQEIEGRKGDPSNCPHLLGHEGCGFVAGIREDSSKFTPGDKVVIHWTKGDGADVGGATYAEREIRSMHNIFSIHGNQRKQGNKDSLRCSI